MAGHYYINTIKGLSATKATRDAQVNADAKLKLYCNRYYLSFYIKTWGEAPPSTGAYA